MIERIRLMMTAVVAGILSSFLFLAIGGRIVLRVLAVVTGRELDFSIEGTIAVLVFSTSIGVIGGLLFSLVAQHIPGNRASKGGYFGLLLFVVLIPMLPASLQEEALALNQHVPLAITLFGLLLMGYGALLEMLHRKLNEIGKIQTRFHFVEEQERLSLNLSNNNQEDSMKVSHKAFLCLVALAFVAQTGVFAQKKGASNKKMVERGAWLVNIGGCHDCHTPKKMGPHGPVLDESKSLSGHPAHEPIPEIPKDVIAPDKWMALTNMHLTAWAGPWGVSYARNLTPDIETGLGSWTDDMFIKTLRLGKHMGEGRAILPPMPWENFSKLDDADLKAIFAYLQSIPPIENAVPDPLSPTGEAVPTPAKK